MIMGKDKQNGGSKPPPYVIFFSAFIASTVVKIYKNQVPNLYKK